MRLFLICALILFILALLVAAGAVILTTWQVWMSAGFVALVLNKFVP